MKISTRKLWKRRFRFITNTYIYKIIKDYVEHFNFVFHFLLDTNAINYPVTDKEIDWPNRYVKRYRYRMIIRKWIKMKYSPKLLFKLVWAIKPKTLDIWRRYLYSSEQFINDYEDDNIKKTIYYQVFMTFKTEYRVLKYLESFGWEVSKARSFYDQFHQIDLFALNKNNQDCVIQVKTKLYQDLKVDKMLKYAKKHNCIPYLAIVSDNQIRLKKLKL
ncbi:hypothetical protein MCAV_00950 [[Mycoplasma] cavipharyngis]|uniref:hypothetical protein n=1 Tax=[Mycoplasma] cavipharyngis TaxID=92757 RepID=UPI003703F97D